MPRLSIRKLISNFREPLRSKFFSLNLLFSIFLNIGIWGLIYFFIIPNSEPVSLHYNIYFGIDLIGEWYKVYFISLSGLIIILVNYLVSAIIYSEKKVLSYLIIGFTALIQMLLALAAILVILINI
ncbi:MAG: hypothetical protein COY66_00090 [Candidatus Kerfeldbacteria bacterium CG_4_10_14_0_8_um_filter_42_10]|uniref:DUF1648 domain-containing protein n=1 Tax=Candidatus Kerfeldbacteria bacterium CG_4_10_14_0_8_um_filter_42_10 TaxID=2014248 RepID=A0A2M7RKJ3_9BACT|nr:MAG: hypothetical protein COY66_00090 [Candidatus Kerfeldbacteria bacterium CG_4_10_14_0_8_um_filter_42_10]